MFHYNRKDKSSKYEATQEEFTGVKQSDKSQFFRKILTAALVNDRVGVIRHLGLMLCYNYLYIRYQRKCDMANIKPLFNNVLLKKVNYKQTQTQAGIYIPEEAQDEAPAMGEVIALGNGKVVKKAAEDYGLKEGLKVLYSRYSGTEVTMEGTEYVLINVKDILAIVD